MTSTATQTTLHRLAAAGQAAWLDFIRRSFIQDGGLARALEQGIRGVTSNPAIFEKAIAGGTEYDDQLRSLVGAGANADTIYEALALDDIRAACDLLRPLYDDTDGADGFVSLEVSPTLAHDTAGTVAEAKRLWAALGRPNAMIKVPATPAGLPAITALIAEGINVNVTLIFAVSQYVPVAEAYIAGLEQRRAAGGELARIASVASFFVSRVDSLVDRELEAKGRSDLAGKAAVANARVAYRRFEQLFSGPRWEVLARAGAKVQRPLWASTGTKNPAYPDTLYVDTLVAKDTVNTMPPATMEAVVDHGSVAPFAARDIDEAAALLDELLTLGIDVDGEVARRLQEEGVKLFADAFTALLAGVEEKRRRLLAELARGEARLGSHAPAVADALAELESMDFLRRAWAGDHTAWKPDPAELANRLGWLRVPRELRDDAEEIEGFVRTVRDDGYTHALLLGMGGSSLAPELFAKTFGTTPGYLDLAVLDSTHAAAVRTLLARSAPEKTLYIVSTKSGGTVETFSFFRTAWNHVVAAVGEEEAGQHFIAITDPGSALAQLAVQLGFRAAWLNNPEIGGRFSALSHFGIVPAALCGVDIRAVLERAIALADASEAATDAREAPGMLLGAAMGELAKAGRDKLTLVLSPGIASFGDWAEQLIAESTGKEGRGILPVAGEALLEPAAYRDDRFFVHLRLAGDTSADEALAALAAGGHPVMTFDLGTPLDLGAQFWAWEMATAVAGQRLGINPFDQPNVEAAKAIARQLVAEYQREGRLPEPPATLREGPLALTADVRAGDVAGAVREFLAAAESDSRPRPYVAIQAYLAPGAATSRALQELRTRIQRRYRVATTVGYGPRFLHSTGQLHKGDAGNGLFIQLTDAPGEPLAIPDEAGSAASSIDFGTLIAAQALGDRQALIDAGRRVLRIHLEGTLDDLIARWPD